MRMIPRVGTWTTPTISAMRSRCLKELAVSLEWMPISTKAGATIPVYSEALQCTDEMNMGHVVRLRFGDSYRGGSDSVLGAVIGL